MLLEQLEERAHASGVAKPCAFDELQRALERTSHTATGTSKCPPVGTVMVLAHVLLRHQA